MSTPISSIMSTPTSSKEKTVFEKKPLTIIKGFARFKVLTAFHPDLIPFFKTVEGRYYEFATKCWSFPNENWSSLKLFFEKNTFEYKVIKAENFATINKTSQAVHLKFGAFQKNFDMLKPIKGVTYCRIISKYVMPLSALPQLESILKDKKFTYNVNGSDEIDSSDGPECSESSESEIEKEEPIKKRLKKISEDREEEGCIDFVRDIDDAIEETEEEEQAVIETPQKKKKNRRCGRNKENDLNIAD